MRSFVFSLVLVSWATLFSIASGQTPSLAVPSAKQLRFADWEVGAFIHFGLNVFTGQEHGDGLEPPSKFNPTQLDADQWIRTAKSMGARYACLTARHEGGFCLWPSRTTEYTIANSPYRAGNGDIVRDYVEACRRHGLKVGLYHTAGFNAHEAIKDYKGPLGKMKWGSTWGREIGKAFKADPTLRDRFDQIQVEQFRELLTDYGPIDFMWSDHWNAADPEGVWRAVTDLAETLQPEMVMMGPDTWVPGNETGHVVYPMWNAVNTVDGTKYTRPAPTDADTSLENDYGLLETDVLTGHPLGKFWRVRECTTNSGFHYGGWFWHPDSVKQTYPRKHWEHLDLYYRTVGLGANTIINLPPDQRGLIPDDFVAAAQKLGNAIQERFSNPIAELATVTAGNIVELAWDQPTEINTIVLMENIASGQKIAQYTLEAFLEGKWQRLEPANKLIGWQPYNTSPGYETIGHKKIDRVRPVTTDRIRFRCLESVAEPVELRSLQVFRCDPVKPEFEAPYPYLSGIETLSESAHGGLRRDTNYVGGKISLRGKQYQFGLLMHPDGVDKSAHAEFDISDSKQITALKAVIGIDDLKQGQGSCRFVVEGYRDQRWEALYRSSTRTGSDPALEISVPMPENLKKVRLKCTDAGNGTNSDHAVWADVRFVE